MQPQCPAAAHQHKQTRRAGEPPPSIPLSLCITRKGVLQSERDEGFALVDEREKYSGASGAGENEAAPS